MDKADPIGDPVLIRDLRDHLKRFKHRIAQVRPNRDGGSDLEFSFEQLLQTTDQVASALKRLGVKRGSAVALIAENSERWLIADLAIMSCGGICVPRGTGSSDAELAFILERTRADVAFVEHPELLDRLRGMRTRLKSRILMYGDAEAGAASFEQLLGATKTASIEDDVRALKPDDVASIVFTSGTTGHPKGVVLTHRNLGSNLRVLREVIHCWQPGDSYLSILPTWHAFERIAEYLLLSMGVGVVYSDRRNLKRDLRNYQPNAFAAVPRVWMMIADAINYEINQLNLSRRMVARLCFWIRRAAVLLERGSNGRTLRRRSALVKSGAALLAAGLSPLDWLADRLVFAPMREKAGLANLVRGAGISGGGSLPQYVDDFFACTGITFLNGYGLTETAPVLTIRVPDHNVAGTVGRPLPGTEIRIVPDEKARESGAGRIIVRGPQVMQGYSEEPEATAVVLAADGWLDTGDLGLQISSGDVVITGRAKDTIVLLNGENIEPEPIEVRLLESPWIQQVVVLGQDQKFIGAIVVPNYQALRSEAQYAKADESAVEQLIRREIDSRICERNGFRSQERIHKFALLDREFSIGDGTLSQTMKLRRHRINELYHDAIKKLFQGDDQRS